MIDHLSLPFGSDFEVMVRLCPIEDCNARYPFTSDPRFISVGSLAIYRFDRPSASRISREPYFQRNSIQPIHSESSARDGRRE